MSAGKMNPKRQQRALGFAAMLLGGLALIVPLWPEFAPEWRIGGLLVLAACIEIFHGFRRSSAASRRAAWFGAVITLAMGLLLMSLPVLASKALTLLIAVWFAVDGVRYAARAARAVRAGEPAGWDLAAGLGNFGVVALVALLGGRGVLWTVAIAGALRIFGAAANILHARVYIPDDAGKSVVRDLRLPDHPGLTALGDQIEAEERLRGPIDRQWIGVFVAILFAIHLGRMGLDRTTLGLVSPGVAVIGDLAVALIIAFGIVVPLNLILRIFFRPLESKVWPWCLSAPKGSGADSWYRRLVRGWLTHRLRFSVRLRKASYSLRTAINRGLQIGLPFAAILAATTPMWGMSWYFDTENWAAGIWNSWAEARTDAWREAMVRAIQTRTTAAGQPSPIFAVNPPGVDARGDFAFIVIGDTGEGDASQHVLRDQLILAGLQPDVRFVVLSSDVVYPVGAMKDYEAKFWLPFKGVQKPVYAIPGNHDWYDALEAFAATFLEPDAARTAMKARIEADLKLSGTTERHIEALIQEAGRLRKEYRVPTGFQQGPFFQFQTDRFALFVVDTGVRKSIDAAQREWLKTALASARGKFKMAILGHPLYATGQYMAEGNDDFAAIHRLLSEHGVEVVMAGDTHDLEYYAEVQKGAGGTRTMHHFVNGGGGAFLSLGTALVPPERMPTREWAFYPATAPLLAKIDANTPFWKAPAWWWSRRFNAWPFSAEWLSAAFDYNVAPFFQSFFEVRVEPSANRVRLLPWGVHGRLRWSDLETSSGLRPAGISADMPAEWIFKLR
jgi:uncharacterized membrane protein HdeD (DUF308 family)/3',5'-cyclic AMP phosphodiesterase CpdA